MHLNNFEKLTSTNIFQTTFAVVEVTMYFLSRANLLETHLEILLL